MQGYNAIYRKYTALNGFHSVFFQRRVHQLPEPGQETVVADAQERTAGDVADAGVHGSDHL